MLKQIVSVRVSSTLNDMKLPTLHELLVKLSNTKDSYGTKQYVFNFITGDKNGSTE